MSRIVAPLFASLVLCAAAAPVALAQPTDALTDPSLKAPEVIAFIGLKPGAREADIMAGRFLRAESAAVGPKGKLYAVMPAEALKAYPGADAPLKAAAAAPGSNIEVLTRPINAMDLPKGLDAVFIRQNYHDLYDKFMGPADVPAFNKAVYAALKPGGVFVILDHAAVAGAPDNVTETLHRIDVARVKADMAKAGFKLDAESKILANPDDDHSKIVSNPAIRGKTDQFLLRFKKPR
jgi:predicted methyltransferase